MNEAKKDGKEGILNLVFNIIIPTIILVKFDSIFNIGPEWGFFIALCFPLLYGCWDLIVSGKYNFFSIIGFLSIILTGGIGLFKLDAHWIAIKEAVVPFTIGIVVLISAKTKFSIIKLFLPKLINMEKVNTIIRTNHNEIIFNKKIKYATYLLSSSFFLSSMLNYILAKNVIVSNTGTASFNQELGKLTALSYPVIVIPCMIMMVITFWYVIHSVKKLTKLSLEEILKR